MTPSRRYHHNYSSAASLEKSIRFGITIMLFSFIVAAAANDARDTVFGGPQCAWFSIIRPVCSR